VKVSLNATAASLPSTTVVVASKFKLPGVAALTTKPLTNVETNITATTAIASNFLNVFLIEILLTGLRQNFSYTRYPLIYTNFVFSEIQNSVFL
jgi:hypothetical protein